MSHALRGETHRRRKREGLERDDPGLPLPSTSGLECRGVSFNADGEPASRRLAATAYSRRRGYLSGNLPAV